VRLTVRPKRRSAVLADVLLLLGIWALAGLIRADAAARSWFAGAHGQQATVVNIEVTGVAPAIPPFWRVTIQRGRGRGRAERRGCQAGRSRPCGAHSPPITTEHPRMRRIPEPPVLSPRPFRRHTEAGLRWGPASSLAGYAAAVELLGHIRGLMVTLGVEAEFAAYLTAVRGAHGRKRNFTSMLAAMDRRSPI
jgi:hypothetical protein